MGKIRYLKTGEIIFDGIKYPGATALHMKISFNPNKWFKHWRQMIKQIKKMKLDYEQIQSIHKNFTKELLKYGYSKQLIKRYQDIDELSNELKIAYYQAYSNYRKSRKGLWAFILGLFINKFIEKLEFPNLSFKIKR